MSTANTVDKKKTERSQASISTAFNDAKLRKSPSAPIFRDGSMPSASNLSPSSPSSARSPRGKAVLPATISKLTQQSQQQQASVADRQPSSPQASPDRLEAQGGDAEPLNLRPDLGMKIEFVLGLSASGILLSLWVFLMTADCYQKPEMVFWVKTFAILGTLAGLFTSIYCCFERSISPARGFASCLYISFLAMVGGLNLVGAYVATTCICSCRDNAIKDPRKDDLVVFILELIGAVCILGVILVASLTRPIM